MARMIPGTIFSTGWGCNSTLGWVGLLHEFTHVLSELLAYNITIVEVDTVT